MMEFKMYNTSTNGWSQQNTNGTLRTDKIESGQNLNYDRTLQYGSGSEYIYDDYNYFSAEIHEEFLSSIHQHTSTFATFLSIWTFLVNILVILACMRNKETRHVGYYNQIVNLSVSNLLISVFVLPLTIYHIKQEWDLGQLLCKIYVISDVLLPFSSISIIILLNIDRLMSIMHPRLYSWIFQKTLKTAIICLPWFVAVIVVIPIWTSGTIPYENGPGECIVLISKESAILCPLITFFIPLTGIIALTFKLLLLKIQLSSTTPGTLESTGMSLKNYQNQQNDVDCERSDFTRRSLPSTSTMETKENRDDLVALCVVNTMFAVMWFPFQCISFLLSFCHSPSCIPSIGLNQVVTWVGASSAGVVPVFWFINSKLRAGLRKDCTKTTHVESAESSHSEETFL
ncbi:5-hydroxytryptamine receptor 5A-like [Mercenaria mercenaria]|uniref:5-hydroxytryptamine receptor 5A-like n=1 Tax=Mercenaria mercenaria TaxID=6596 RepID=UPI001E1DEE22|nr:5-hydroxytryptamine receptor 5A-like [Mercenaria mercenaria]XP_053405960.1 5-hydroxytryptamine receptor 5A-like [Mercenaria mercenaria]